MAYRENVKDLGGIINDLERRVRNLERNVGAVPPDPGWILIETNGSLQYLYVPTGALGIEIGVK
jgi:hypothetical protein